ncbi:DUF2927 domain-containing protein [Roseovarius faecimaris]|uniref:DUF2927 domain-containing protein n=1 Tax=Roseovarius faecimaris TaxID=2494550 RepID=A0A6I6ITN4_9RHOB|nr:DUF2927 domain-containing protein [Roseovarius faecimaris]QGX98857.1 DUF2927 domain-containing protein [Roseovarius faecimaris]
MRGRLRAWGLAGLGILALASCDTAPSAPGTTPKPRPPGLLAPPPSPPAAARPSARSEQLAFYYQRVQQGLLAQDLLRVDGGGVDTPYNSRNLARNFEKIAFYEEFAPNSIDGPSGGEALALERWDQPVRFGVEFGSTIPQEAQERDTGVVRDFAKRLSRITRHPISLVTNNPNFHVFFMGLDDKDYLISRLKQIAPQTNEAAIVRAFDSTKLNYCFVFTFAGGENDYTPEIAIAVIRTELPALMRSACIHEELAQGLGLANDSPRARPSIFNDDDEFALLTTHDEELLRLLYDPALTPGMSVDEARPVVLQILAGRSGPS